MRESGVWGAGLEKELQGSVSLGTTDQLNLTPRLGSEPQFPKHLSPRYCRRMNRPRKFWEFVLISIRHGTLQRRLRQAKHGNIALLEPLNPMVRTCHPFKSYPYPLSLERYRGLARPLRSPFILCYFGSQGRKCGCP